jgi:hypothetical protein
MIYRKQRADGLSEHYYYDFEIKGKRYAGNTEQASKQRAKDFESELRRMVKLGQAAPVKDVTF